MRCYKKYSIVVIVIFFWAISLFAQPPDTLWTRTYGGPNQDYAFGIQLTYDNGYIITGLTSSYGAGGDDVYLVKTDANGNVIWTKTFGGPGQDWGRSGQPTKDGGYIVAGWTTSFGSGYRDVYLIKTDGNGNAMWTKTFGGEDEDRGYFVQQTPDGGYIVVGTTWSFGAGGGDVYLIKTDALGNALWTRTYGGSGYDFCRSIKFTPDSGFVMAGQTSSFGHGGWDVYLIRTNKNGDMLWSKTYGGPDDDLGCSVGLTSDGGCIVTGGTMSFGAGDWDVYLVKTDSGGNALWSKTFGGYSEERCHEVFETSDQGFIVFGFTSSFGAGQYDFYLIKTDANGNSQWTKTWGGSAWDMGEGVKETSDGGYIMSGYTESFGAGNGDFWVIKTKPTTAMVDVGVTQILAPTGTILQGSQVIPKVVVRNFGSTMATFPVVFEINMPTVTGHLNERVHQITDDGIYSDTVEVALPVGAIDTVEFAPWQAILGDYNTISYTMLGGDENPSNDTAYGTFKAVSGFGHDVGVLQILNPLDTIYAGTLVSPVAEIKNFGQYDENVLVFFIIIGEYLDFQFVSLGAGQTDTIIFDPWFALAGNYNEEAATYLQTDENPDNNVVLEILRVFGVKAEGISELPKKSNLFKPYPNPTTNNLHIRFALSKTSRVDMKVYDINGRVVKSLISGNKSPGTYSLNTNCDSYRNGVYIVKLKAGEFEAIQKFTVAK
jgi:Secretion system C-terminal sorting domain